MGEPRLSVIIISLLVIALFSVGFMGFYDRGSVDYDIKGFNNSEFDYIENVSSDVANNAFRTTNATEGLGSSIDSEQDVFGSFFSQAWTALKTTGKSLDNTQELVTNSSNKIPLLNNSFKNVLKTFLITSAIIIFVVGILLHFVKQSNRL